MADVRSRQGVPAVSDFSGSSGTPVVVDRDTGTGYVLKSDNTIAAFGGSASGPVTGLTMATNRVLGRTTAGTGAVEELTVGAGLSLTAGVLAATGGSSTPALRRNLLINASARICQRTTGPSSPTLNHTQTNYYGLDHWGAYRAGNVGNIATRGDPMDAAVRAAFPEPLPLNEIAVIRTSGDASGAQTFLQQAVEATDCVHTRGKAVVFSFIARKLAAYSGGDVTYRILQHAGSTDSRVYNFTTPTVVASGTFTPSLTATRYEITGTVASTTTQLGVEFSQFYTGSGGGLDYLLIAAPQLELGTTRSLFENLLYQDELSYCQRYYEKSYDLGSAPGTSSNNGLCMGGIAGNGTASNGIYLKFKKQKRNASYAFRVWDGPGNVNRYSTRVGGVWSHNNGAVVPILASADGLICDSGATALNNAYAHFDIENDF